jgi:hypothetical protein
MLNEAIESLTLARRIRTAASTLRSTALRRTAQAKPATLA